MINYLIDLGIKICPKMEEKTSMRCIRTLIQTFILSIYLFINYVIFHSFLEKLG